MSAPDHSSGKADAIAARASYWVSLRDRGLSAEEQDEYIQWLAADPRHGAEIARHAAAFQRMMRLYEWQPSQSMAPNPDLFARPRRRRLRAWAWGIAAAAVLAVSVPVFWSRLGPSAPAAESSYLVLNESRVLPDGSIVELKEGSEIELRFSDLVRSVRLKGEAHFTVAKGAIPFVVEAGNVSVRALGTAFNVRTDQSEVDVLVTEGTVRVAHSRPESAHAKEADAPVALPSSADESTGAAAADPSFEVLVAGQRARVQHDPGNRPQVSDVTSSDIERSLSWQAPRLRFSDTPLSVAVAQFNQRNRTRLVLGHPDLGTIPIGGTFRVDNVDAFVRLLEVTLDIRAERRAGGKIILTRER